VEVGVVGKHLAQGKSSIWTQFGGWSCWKIEVDALGVITISRGYFERCGSNKKTPP